MCGDIGDMLDEIEANAAKGLKPRRVPVLENLAGYLFVKFTYHTDFFSEQAIDRLSIWGQRIYNKYSQQYRRVDRAIVQAVHEDDVRLLDAAKKESGIYNPNRFSHAVCDMMQFCQLYSENAEVNCMQMNLRANSGVGLAAAFYYPALRWELFKSLFKRG